jgi:membrane-associated protease RseP (regulator of RpoE activity)
VTETWIAEGEQPESILQNMAINPEVMQKVEVEKLSTSGEGERLFLYRHAGDHAAVEVRLDSISPDQVRILNPGEKVIVWTHNNDEHAYKISKWYSKDANLPWEYAEERKANCAALGIYVNSSGDETGCHINSLIENGGAQAAGLQEGDVITKIDDYAILDFATLYDVLKGYLPGDDVTVYYNRDGKTAKANVHLKSWSDLPGHEWRARGDCGKVEDFKEETVQPQMEPTPAQQGPVGLNELNLQDARLYPNPTQGAFSLSFTTEPGPINIIITDVNGKIIYSEDNDNATGYYNKTIDLKSATPGNYVVNVKQGDKIFNQQISKQ